MSNIIQQYYGDFHDALTLPPQDITSKVESDRGESLRNAIASGSLFRSGYNIGDYFYSHSSHTMYNDADNSGNGSQATVKFKYTLADVDTYYGGYTNNAVVDTHHLAIIVDTMIASRWQTNGTTFNGYTGSRLQERLVSSDILGNIKSDLAYIIPSSDSATNHLVSHNKLFSKGTSGNEWAWVNSQVISALTEMDIYGAPIWSGNSYQQGEAVRQLEVFRKYRFNLLFGNVWFWLRSLNSASGACVAHYTGYAGRNGVGYAGRAVGLILFY